jgi:Nucleotidyl transferase AbiEii toxin, Type IV TA system
VDIDDLDSPERVTCLSLRYQIAQKIHAVTEEPADGRPNLRYWDLIDLILLRALLEEDLWRVQEACVQTFESRKTHSWPPELVIPDAWEQPYTAEAEKLGFTPADVHGAAAEIRAFIAEIDAAEQ